MNDRLESAELSIEDLEAVARAALLDEDGTRGLHGISNGSFHSMRPTGGRGSEPQS